MKISSKALSVVLAVIMLFSCVSVAFAAQSFSGTVEGDITISYGATIQEGTVFTGNITVAQYAAVNNGIFKGAVTNNGTISGGRFDSAVTNNGSITAGTFNGTVSNLSGSFLDNTKIIISCGISGGTFNGAVTNNAKATIGGGIFKGSVTNNSGALISFTIASSPDFDCKVKNDGYISGGEFKNEVQNNGNISLGTFGNVIDNNGTVASAVSAIVKEGNAYSVKGSPAISGKITISAKDSTFEIANGRELTVGKDCELVLNCGCTVNGTIKVKNGGKLTSNSGTLTGASAGKITVDKDSSFGGINASKFDYITYKEYKITYKSNIDANQFDFYVKDYAYKGETVSYSFDISGTFKGCLSLNSVTVYNGREKSENIVCSSADISESFTMPDNNAIVVIDCVANHTTANEHKDAECENAGYDRTYCTNCQHEISRTVIPAKGHKWSEWQYVQDDSNVLKTRTCPECKKTEKAYVEILYEILGINMTVDYKSSMSFHANVKAEDGYKLYWKYNNGSPVADNGTNSFTVENAVSDFTVQAVIMGTVNDMSQVQKITVKHGFFDKFIAFFRNLFKILPVYVDNIKQ